MTASKSSIFRALARSRRSSRRFQTEKSIPEKTMRDILESTLRSPSSFNLQPTQIILVQSQQVKTELAEHAMLGPGNQFRARDASALAFFLADLEPTKRLDRIYRLEKESQQRHPNYLSTLPMIPSFLIGEGHAATLLKSVATSLLSEVQPMPTMEPVQAWGYKNASLMAQTFVLAAESHDLATCIMEGFDARRVQQILQIPDRYTVPLVVATGYEYENPQDFSTTPRLDLHEVVFNERFGIGWKQAMNAVDDFPKEEQNDQLKIK